MLSAVLDRVLGGPVLPDGAIRESVVMGTLFRVEVAGLEREEAFAVAEDALREVERLDRALTTWDPSSPMSLLNQRRWAGRLAWKPSCSISWSRPAHGLGAPEGRSILPSVRSWTPGGCAGLGARPDGQGLVSARCATGGSLFTLDRGEGTLTRHHPRAWIDTDGFGKGRGAQVGGGEALRCCG